MQNNPIFRLDPDGKLDNPIYGSDGLLRGYDSEGLEGESIIYDGEFNEGMDQKEILNKGGDYLSNVWIRSHARGDAIVNNIRKNKGNDAGRVDTFFLNQNGEKQYVHEYELKKRQEEAEYNSVQFAFSNINGDATDSVTIYFATKIKKIEAADAYSYLESIATQVNSDSKTNSRINTLLGILPEVGNLVSISTQLRSEMNTTAFEILQSALKYKKLTNEKVNLIEKTTTMYIGLNIIDIKEYYYEKGFISFTIVK